MAHMQALPRRIGKFHKTVKLGLAVVNGRVKTALFLPDVLPFLFDGCKIVFHCPKLPLPGPVWGRYFGLRLCLLRHVKALCVGPHVLEPVKLP